MRFDSKVRSTVASRCGSTTFCTAHCHNGNHVFESNGMYVAIIPVDLLCWRHELVPQVPRGGAESQAGLRLYAWARSSAAGDRLKV